MENRHAARTVCLCASDLAPLVKGNGGQFTCAAKVGVDRKRGGIDIGIVFGRADIGARHKFQPHGLPDARSARIEAGEGFIAVGLLARRDHAILSIVLGVDGHGVLARARVRGNIKGKGHVAARVTAALTAVDINGGLVIHRAEMQDHAATKLLLGEGEGALIPDRAHKIGASDARKRAFGAEGDLDHGIQRLALLVKRAVKTALAAVDLKLPAAVEILPMLPHELRLGMLFSVCHDIFSFGNFYGYFYYTAFIPVFQ